MARDEDSHRDETGEADRLLVELLYGELDGDAADQGRARVEADPARRGELEAYGRVRSLLRELPEEEPSPAISAQLLHAAAHAVKGKAAPAEKVGLWARLRDWLAPIALHPGMAAVATLVLVGGVAGTLYLRGQSRVAEPMLRSSTEPRGNALQAPAEPAAAAPASVPETAAAPPTPSMPALEGRPGDSSGGVASGKSDSSRLAEPEERSRPRGDELQKAPARRAKDAEKAKIDVGSAPGADVFDDGEGGGGRGAKGDKVGGSGVAVRGTARGSIDVTTEEPAAREYENAPAGGAPAPAVAAPAAEPSPPPPPRPQATPKPAETAADKPPANLARAQALDLTKKATALARSGDCRTALRLAPDVRRLDSNVYDSVYLRDPAITTCRTAPARK
jgi:hypothetical protein